MAKEPNATRRWQFTLRGIFVYTVLSILPFVTWSWAARIQNDKLLMVGVGLAAGLIGATVSWLLHGTRRGLLSGYLSGIAIVVAMPTMLEIVSWMTNS